jgi:hypothetical protein
MIHYQLRCSADHGFDGWFRDSAAFDAQAERGLVECPACGDTRVNRALMAPRIAKSRPVLDGKTGEPAAVPVPTPEMPVAGKDAVLPDKVRAALQRLRAEVERNCDYVGQDFAEEARRIHHGEAESRGIYGESTPEQAEALADDGIEVAWIPWLPRADS